jgi:N utilization substance protein A
VGEGFLSFDDLEVIEPDALMEMGSLTEEQANLIVEQAEVKAREAEQAAAIERRRQREQERIDTATAAADAAAATEREAAAERAAAAAAGGANGATHESPEADTPPSETASGPVGPSDGAI